MFHLEEMTYLKVGIIIAGYALTMLLSGFVVRVFIGLKSGGDLDSDERARRNLGRVIGKCENFLAVTFILAGEITGLALIFAAKSIIRKGDVERDPTYYLGGTLVNFCFSVLMGYATRLVLFYFTGVQGF